MFRKKTCDRPFFFLRAFGVFFSCPCYIQCSMLSFQFWLGVGVHCVCTLTLHHIISLFFCYRGAFGTVRRFTPQCLYIFLKKCLVRGVCRSGDSSDPSVCPWDGIYCKVGSRCSKNKKYNKLDLKNTSQFWYFFNPFCLFLYLDFWLWTKQSETMTKNGQKHFC